MRTKGTNQTIRVVQMLNRLRCEPDGLKMRTLATELGVTPRQVRRDLHLIQRMGFVVDLTPIGGRSGARLAA